MTQYVKSTSFASKDALPQGNPLKIVKGTEIDTEFNNIAVAVATKADLLNPVFTGTPTAATAATSTVNTQLATTQYVATKVLDLAAAKDGTGATGTWPISITGNATTATTASNGGVTSVNGSTGAVVVSPPTTSNVLAALAGTTAGVVGSYAFLSCVENVIVSVGATKAGSNLRYRSAQSEGGRFGSGNYVSTPTGPAPAGTWMLMGYIEGYFEYNGVNTNHQACSSLWLRVS